MVLLFVLIHLARFANTEMEAFDMKKKILTVLLCLIFVVMSCLFVACDEVEQEEAFPYVHSSLGLEGMTDIGALVRQQDQYLDVYPNDDLGNATIVYKSTFNGEYPSLVNGSRSKVYETTQLPKYEVVIWQYETEISVPIYVSDELYRTDFGSQETHYDFADRYITLGDAFSKTKDKVAVEDVPYFRPNNYIVNTYYKEIDSVTALINQDITSQIRSILNQDKEVLVGGEYVGQTLESNQKAIVMREVRAYIKVAIVQVYKYSYVDSMEVKGTKRYLTYEFLHKELIDNCATWITYDIDENNASVPVEIIFTMNEDGTYTVTNPHQEYQGGLFV